MISKSLETVRLKSGYAFKLKTRDRNLGCLAVKGCAGGLLSHSLLASVTINYSKKDIFGIMLHHLFLLHNALQIKRLQSCYWAFDFFVRILNSLKVPIPEGGTLSVSCGGR